MKERFRLDKQNVQRGITDICVIAVGLVLYFAIRNISAIGGVVGNVVRILAPFIWGLAIAYLLSPLMDLLEKRLFLPLSKRLYRKSKKRDGRKFARTMSVLLSEIVLVLLLVALVNLIIPQMISSIQTLLSNSSTYMDNLSAWLDSLLQNYPELDNLLDETFGEFNTDVGDWLETTVLPRLGSLVASVTSRAYGVAKSVYNLIIGIIVSIYLLSEKEGYLAAMKRLNYTIFPLKTADKVRLQLAFVDKTFMGFLNGKLVDSLIMGVLCYIGCSLLKMPYVLLVSVIVGVTNIIPFFGPFIGAIPSALIILMVAPSKCLVFVLFIIVLQQIDGNIIGPHILGNSIGITGFWVMFAIILGGGLFGFWGLLLGVPVFVVIYTAVTSLVVDKLQKNDLPTELEVYKGLEYIDPSTSQIVMKSGSSQEASPPAEGKG